MVILNIIFVNVRSTDDTVIIRIIFVNVRSSDDMSDDWGKESTDTLTAFHWISLNLFCTIFTYCTLCTYYISLRTYYSTWLSWRQINCLSFQKSLFLNIRKSERNYCWPPLDEYSPSVSHFYWLLPLEEYSPSVSEWDLFAVGEYSPLVRHWNNILLRSLNFIVNRRWKNILLWSRN